MRSCLLCFLLVPLIQGLVCLCWQIVSSVHWEALFFNRWLTPQKQWHCQCSSNDIQSLFCFNFSKYTQPPNTQSNQWMCGQRPWNCKISTPNTITGTISDIYWWCSEPGTNSWLCLILRTSNTNTQGSNRMTDRWPGNETQESQDWTIFLQDLEVWGNRVCFLFCLTSTLYWCYLDSSVGTIAFFFSRCYGMNKHDQRLDM